MISHDSEFEASLETSKTYHKNVNKNKTAVNMGKKKAKNKTMGLSNVNCLYSFSWSKKCFIPTHSKVLGESGHVTYCCLHRGSPGPSGEVKEPGAERRSGLIMMALWVWLVRAS